MLPLDGQPWRGVDVPAVTVVPLAAGTDAKTKQSSGVRLLLESVPQRKAKLMHWKGILVIAVLVVVTMAVVSRVAFLSNLVFGPSQKA